MPHPANTSEDRSLISNATILILSGFLIGLTVGKIVADELSPYVLACGLSGFLAFVALELAAERRKEEAAHAEQTRINRRLNRHVELVTSQPASAADPAEQDDFDEAYRLAAMVHVPSEFV
jgi:hypothetical protein